MNVVHFSKTPLAGAAIRLVHALQCNTGYNARLVDLKRWGLYDHDVIHAENPDEALELAERADIIHLHNYLDYGSKDFHPIDFNSLRRQDKVFVRQFHSHPALVAREMRINVSDLLTSSIPSLVIAQFQERYYPKARVVPNIIPQGDPSYKPSHDGPLWGIFFSPGPLRSAWDDRWNTKGMPETLSLMKQVARYTGCTLKCVTAQPLVEVMREKRRAFLVIDDLVTGSYHLSGLEGLSLGKPVLAFLDARIQHVLHEITGADASPFINARLEDAFEVLVYLLKHPDETADIGKASRAWIEHYWSDRILVQHFVDVYEKLLIDPTLIVRQESLSLDNRVTKFHATILPDLTYESRAKHYKDSLPLKVKVRNKIKDWGKLYQSQLRQLLPTTVIIFLRKVLYVIRRMF